MERARNPEPSEGDKRRRTRRKLILRFLVVDVVAYVIVALIFEAARRVGLIEIQPSGLSTIFGVFFVAHVLATIAGYLPAGVDYVQLRLGLAAFCRTIFPLLALLLVEQYVIAVLHRQNLFVIASFYFLSLGLGLWTASINAK
jgi:hypothetical protein